MLLPRKYRKSKILKEHLDTYEKGVKISSPLHVSHIHNLPEIGLVVLLVSELNAYIQINKESFDKIVNEYLNEVIEKQTLIKRLINAFKGKLY